MKKAIVLTLITIAVIALIFVTGPALKAFNNRYAYNVQKADDATNYKTLKEVEDSCRAMMASYEADRLIFEQYRKSENEDAFEWAEQAKMRANRTAAQYNEFIRKNSFVWKDAIPDDIDEKLEYLE